MKSSPIQPTFSGGEFSPKVVGRVDNERYKTGLAKALNFLPTVQGPLIRRPGTKYVGNDVKDPSKPPAFIPFQFSQTQNYVLEFGQQYIRFYANGGQVVTNTTVFRTSGLVYFTDALLPTLSFTALQSDPYSRPGLVVTATSAIASGSVLELVSPFLQPECHNIKYAQSGDTLYLAQSSNPIYKLQRFSNYEWVITPVIMQDGPYLPVNSYNSIGDSVRIGLNPNDPGLPIITTTPTYNIYAASDNGAGQIRIRVNTTHLYASGDKVAVRGVTGAVEANNGTSHVGAEYWTITDIGADTFDLNGSAFVGAATNSSGIVSPALFELVSTNPQVPPVWADASPNRFRNIAFIQNGKRYWGIISGVANAGTAGAIMYEQLAYSSHTVTWQLGPWNRKNGYPSAICFHQDRLALAGAKGFPQRYDLSTTGEYENFAPSSSSLVVTDNNAISFNTIDQTNMVNWVKSDSHGLLAGAVDSEWLISPNNQAAAISPTNVNAKQTSYFGSHTADAVQTGNATLYVQKGQRRLRELNYFYQVDTYRSTDIAELSDHLMLPGISKLANQKETVPVVWALTTDGNLRSMTYSRDDANLKVGWAQHQLGGQSDSSGTAPVIQSMAVIPSPDGTFDQLWCATRRFINGTTVCNVEYMTKAFDDQTDIEDSLCLDLSGTYDSPITISRISQGGSAIVTATAHGLVDGDQIKINAVVGVNSSFTDVNGVVFNSNLVNGQLFRVGSTSTNAFFLQDINNGSSYIDSRSYTPYFSSGEARKLIQTISGLTWLKSETVSILADGKVHPATQVNSAGVLSLQYKAAVVQIGYNYNSDAQTLRPDAGSADGSSFGMKRRPAIAGFMLHKAGEMSIGPSFDRLTPLTLENLDQPQADVAVPLFSGIVRESIESEHDFEGQICFRMNSPLPGMVQAVTVMLETNDV